MEKNNFILYTDYFEQIQMLTIEQRGVLLTACMLYQMGEELPEMDAITRMCFMFISADIRRNNEKYEKIVERRAEAGRKGGYKKWENLAKLANASDASENLANLAKASKSSDKDKDNDKEKDNVNVNVNVNESQSDGVDGLTEQNPSLIPTVKEVDAYIRANNLRVNAFVFYAYYQKEHWTDKNGQPIKDWQAVCLAWHKNGHTEKEEQKRKPSKGRWNDYEQRTYTEDELEGLLVETE